jgi:threonine/homoserine/homoserine lactone efflux protein
MEAVPGAYKLMQVVQYGIKLGLVLAFLIGPVFFTILHTSLEKGFSKGALVALGVSLSDLVYVSVCYLGLAQLVNQPVARQYMAWVGGFVLIAFGLVHLLVKTRSAPQFNQPVSGQGFFRYVVKGFVINGLSPMVLVFWLATLSAASVSFGFTRHREYLIFFAALLGTVFVTDLLKAYLAGRLRKLIRPRVLRVLHIVVGLALLGFGARLLWVGHVTF